jgi:uncharacterized protein (DUF924 family)
LIILLEQMSRNIFRGRGEAFAKKYRELFLNFEYSVHRNQVLGSSFSAAELAYLNSAGERSE